MIANRSIARKPGGGNDRDSQIATTDFLIKSPNYSIL